MKEKAVYKIKTYRVKNLIQKENKTWDLEYVGDLPYIFNDKPIELRDLLNEIFKDIFEHVIDVY